MGRYNKSFDNVSNIQVTIDKITSYLSNEGFKSVEFKGEQVWKKGSGLISLPQFIKIINSENSITLEAWLKIAILPGLFVGEMGISGFYAAIPKQMLKKRVKYIENLFK